MRVSKLFRARARGAMLAILGALFSPMSWGQDLDAFTISAEDAEATLMPYEISVETAERIAKACVAWAQEQNRRVSVVIVAPGRQYRLRLSHGRAQSRQHRHGPIQGRDRALLSRLKPCRAKQIRPNRQRIDDRETWHVSCDRRPAHHRGRRHDRRHRRRRLFRRRRALCAPGARVGGRTAATDGRGLKANRQAGSMQDLYRSPHLPYSRSLRGSEA